MYANDVSMSGYVIEDILIKFVTPRLCKESRLAGTEYILMLGKSYIK